MPIDPLALFVALPVVGLTAFGVYFLCAAAIDQREETDDKSEVAEPTTSPRSRLFTGTTWLLAVFYIVMGLPKLGELSGAVHQFEHWGYSESFMLFIGALEFLSAIGLVIPRARLVAAGFLSVVMSGAIYTHIAFDPAWYVLLPTTCLALLVFIGYESARKEWHRADSLQEAAGV